MPTHIEREVFSATESLGPVNYVLPFLYDSFVKRAILHEPQIHIVVRETFSASETASYRGFVSVRETFSANDRNTTMTHYRMFVREQFWADDRTSHGTLDYSVLREVFAASERTQAKLRVPGLLREVFAADDVVTVGLTSTRAVRETFSALDRITRRQREVVREVFIAVERTTEGGARRHIEREVFEIAARPVARSNDFAQVRERFVALDHATPVGTILGFLHEQFRIDDWVRTQSDTYADVAFAGMVPLDATDAWTADMRSWGMSRYVGLGVTEMDGAQYGVGPGGVFRAVAAPVLSFVETGDTKLEVQDQPIHLRKRLNYLYTYSEHTEPLDVLATADHNGERLSTLYQQDARASTDTRAVRCQIGRGYVSNYIRLRVGGERVFDMAGMEVEITPTQRRI